MLPSFSVLLSRRSARTAMIFPTRVDRSIQVTLEPGRLEIDYEVSLSELTLSRDLRMLVGVLPGADRHDWFDSYGREVGPLNGRGLLLAIDGVPLEAHFRGFDLDVAEHPRYRFHYQAETPPEGRLQYTTNTKQQA